MRPVLVFGFVNQKLFEETSSFVYKNQENPISVDPLGQSYSQYVR